MIFLPSFRVVTTVIKALPLLNNTPAAFLELLVSISIMTEGLPELEYLALGNSVANVINSSVFPRWDTAITFSTLMVLTNYSKQASLIA
jgi:uncharacterized protein YejL (UPF0352 family)